MIFASFTITTVNSEQVLLAHHIKHFNPLTGKYPSLKYAIIHKMKSVVNLYQAHTGR